jgi:hypothetical protein
MNIYAESSLRAEDRIVILERSQVCGGLSGLRHTVDEAIDRKTRIGIARTVIIAIVAYVGATCLGFIRAGHCTALEITNVSQTNWNSGAGTVDVRFDITWKDSWRVNDGPANWDAVWVFIKFRRNSGAWQHASLMDSGHSVAAGYEILRGLAN